MRRFFFNKCLVPTALILLMHRAVAQTPEMSFRAQDVPVFYEDVTTFASDTEGKSRLIVDTRIAHDELQFVSTDDGYRAEYEISVTVFNPRGDQADGRIVKRTVRSMEYEQTNLQDRFDLSRLEFLILPGEYDVFIGMMDLDSKKMGHRKVNITVPDYEEASLAVSSLVLADGVSRDSAGVLEYEPNVMSNFGTDQEELYLVFEVYHPGELDVIPVSFRILSLKNKSLRRQEYDLPLYGEKTTEVITIQRGELKSGRYRLELELGKRGESIKGNRDFSVQWIGMPTFATDLDKAVEQLRYIVRGSDIKKMKKADDEQKEVLFRDFWSARDQTPSTSQNELMEEYYRRIQYANANFSTYREGWETDMGMVYIILGPPDDIERHPFDQGSKPYEIWTYYMFNRDFVFVDETGFGEFRLRSPSSFWQVVNELRR